MSKYIFVFLLVFLLPGFAFASSLQLTRIGSMDTTGGSYNQWWYTGTNPSLQGMSLPNSSITVTIDGVGNVVTSDESGYWIYSGSSLDMGDHEIIISDGTDTISFTLHTGQNMDNTETVTAYTEEYEEVEMPVSGNGTITILTALFGLLLMWLGLRKRFRLSLQVS